MPQTDKMHIYYHLIIQYKNIIIQINNNNIINHSKNVRSRNIRQPSSYNSHSDHI